MFSLFFKFAFLPALSGMLLFGQGTGTGTLKGGNANTKLDDTEATVGAFQHALSSDPHNKAALLGLGLLYWRAGSLEKALPLYRKVIVLEPDDATAFRDYSLLLVDAGKFSEAIPALNKVKANDPKDVPVRAALIHAYSAGHADGDVERETKEFLLQRVDDLALMLGVVQSLKAASYGDLSGAVLAKASQLFPNSAPVHAELGKLSFEHTQYEEAAVEFGTAVQLDPKNSSYSLALGRVLLQWHHYSTAYDYLNAIKPRFGSLPEFQYQLAYARYGQRRYEDSLAAVTALLRDYPKYADGEYLRGNCYWAMNDSQSAIDAYTRAIALDNYQASYYIGLATALQASNSIHSAAQNLQMALRLDPTNLEAKTNLAICLEKEGQTSVAMRLLEEAERAAPQVSRVHSLLSRLYYKAGKREDAEREHALAQQLLARELAATGQQAGGLSQP